jgi:hypothetical protein
VPPRVSAGAQSQAFHLAAVRKEAQALLRDGHIPQREFPPGRSHLDQHVIEIRELRRRPLGL